MCKSTRMELRNNQELSIKFYYISNFRKNRGYKNAIKQRTISQTIYTSST